MAKPVEQNPDFQYVGEELNTFSLANNWRAYWFAMIEPFLGTNLLEVGSGIGSNVPELAPKNQERRLTCLEPDARQIRRLRKMLESLPEARAAQVETVRGDLTALEAGTRFDTILYIDVLEHIQDDQAEVRRAAQALERGGRLIVLSPAFPWLYSPFDKALGHYRRYTRQTLVDAAKETPELRLEKMIFLDVLGFCSSCANRLLLRQSLPSARQIRFWDGKLVPLSRRLDPLLGHRVGKSLLAIWEKA